MSRSLLGYVQPRSESSKPPKPPKPPEKPLMPYMRYSRRVWDSVKAENPNLKLWEVGKIIGHMWRELSDEDKQQFVDEYEAEKLRHAEAMRQYHSSAAYQAWLAAKERAAAGDHQQHRRRDNFGQDASHLKELICASREDPAQSPSAAAAPGDSSASAASPSFSLPDEATAIKEAATGRYRRNHCLMLQLLSPARVPDARQQLTQPSTIQSLRRQSAALSEQRDSAERELQELELRHERLKRRCEEAAAEFRLRAERPQLLPPCPPPVVRVADDQLLGNGAQPTGGSLVAMGIREATAEGTHTLLPPPAPKKPPTVVRKRPRKKSFDPEFADCGSAAAHDQSQHQHQHQPVHRYAAYHASQQYQHLNHYQHPYQQQYQQPQYHYSGGYGYGQQQQQQQQYLSQQYHEQHQLQPGTSYHGSHGAYAGYAPYHTPYDVYGPYRQQQQQQQQQQQSPTPPPSHQQQQQPQPPNS